MEINSLIYSIQIGNTPIYRQIVERITHQVAAGKLVAGEFVPSVRELARLIAVNPMTISKAYTILTEQKILKYLSGRGLYVISKPASIEVRCLMLKPYVKHVVDVASDLGLDYRHIIKLSM